MSREFTINSENITKDVFLNVAKSIGSVFESTEIANDEVSLWIPSDQPNWIDFSLELTPTGFFVVSNFDGVKNKKILHIIADEITSTGIDFEIEDV